jgi:uncharacterized membrane protein YdjX (TVP38/TMEM64 family)
MSGRDRWIAALTLVAIISLVAWSYATGGLAAHLLSTSLEGSEKARSLQDYFASWGALAPVDYIAIVAIEVVVAPIPGTLLYVPGGLIFGWQVGGLTALVGNVIGAGICCSIARSLGRPYVERFFSRDAVSRYDTMLGRHAVWVIALLRVNPLTSSDLVSYAAGLTSMATWRVMVGTLIGMAPLCFLQAYFAEEIFTRFPALIYPLVAVCALYVAYVAWVLARLKTPATELEGAIPSKERT